MNGLLTDLDSCSKERFSLYPIKYANTFEVYLQAVASFWTVSEVDLTVDLDDFARFMQNLVTCTNSCTYRAWQARFRNQLRGNPQSCARSAPDRHERNAGFRAVGTVLPT
jgi:spore coat polysaccharide biosynthesis protein SpsF (cytidylyltransferase family)